MTSGFSKWSSAGGWRVGYALLPDSSEAMLEMKKALIGASSHTFSCAPAPMQHALAKGLENGKMELDAYIEKEIKTLKAVSEFVVE